MRYLITGLIFLKLLVLFSCQGGSESLRFDKLKTDVGTIGNARATDTVVFTCKNRLKTPVMIRQIQSTDLAVSAEWDREPLLPGKSAAIKILLNGAKLTGKFSVRLFVFTGQEGFSCLTVTGTGTKSKDNFDNQIGGLRLNKKAVHFGQVFAGGVATDTLLLYNPTAETVTCKFHYDAETLRVMIDKTYLQPGDTTRVVVKFVPGENPQYGTFQYYMMWAGLSRPGDRNPGLPITGKVIENFLTMNEEERRDAPKIETDRQVYDFGNISEGQKVSCVFKIENQGKKDLIIRNITTACGCTAAVPGRKMIAPGESCDLKVTFNATGREGRQSKTIALTCNDYRSPEMIWNIKANVMK